ncbi:MAG: hypothetical protein RLZZ241_930 [Bacteroidota bacterium]|jgi:D-alanyl-D-alanine dipeptidase
MYFRFHSVKIVFLLVLILEFGCKNQSEHNTVNPDGALDETVSLELKNTESTTVLVKDLNQLPDTLFVRLADYSKDFSYDLRYATPNNFLKTAVYPCAECYTRVKTAKALISANSTLMRLGYRIRFFDCYRPNAVQFKMWDLVPNPQYVADPVKGSIHNRGGAVDITLESLDGIQLDMGTDFDFFGKEAYHDNINLSESVLQSRRLLKETMEAHGFWSVRTEWWHYNFKDASRDPVANFSWECQDS